MLTLRPYQQTAVAECWAALKKDDKPVLLVASVGSGKSLMLASILLSLQKQGKRALCLVNNAELVRNNCETFVKQGGEASIYCAALGAKSCELSVVFGTPQTVLNGINKSRSIAKIKFNIILVDEAHSINYLNHQSTFMRILRYYKTEYPDMRVLGATGTDFRFKGSAIVGEKCLFRSQVGNVTTDKLINDGYLVKPDFEISRDLVLDFSGVRVKSNGQFDTHQLDAVVEQSTRLTALICQQVIHVMESQNRFGVFLFATTRKHAFEIFSHLPKDQSAIILGETTQDERTKILDEARIGKIRYLVNIAIISVGVDVAAFDTLAYLRPTESLVLLVQTMGRVLRLSAATNKESALVLDFAGNIERHKDWDHPVLMDAVEQALDIDNPKVIICPVCSHLNTVTARRCMGRSNNNRCDFFFEFKECECGVQNDVTARACRACDCELIDPNAKLSFDSVAAAANVKPWDVKRANYSITGGQDNFTVRAVYDCNDENGNRKVLSEYYYPKSFRSKNMFYGQFVSKHCKESSKWYPYLHIYEKMRQMLSDLVSPVGIVAVESPQGFKIKSKLFHLDNQV